MDNRDNYWEGAAQNVDARLARHEAMIEENSRQIENMHATCTLLSKRIANLLEDVKYYSPPTNDHFDPLRAIITFVLIYVLLTESGAPMKVLELLLGGGGASS